ncbi:MAG: deoxyguanosinetriphosphate triphosphohydrolase [Burkholderiales bacterium]|nr:deoxyguanosinetriphosphate triphosphohydrolase [Burkholderiales bacterium]
MNPAALAPWACDPRASRGRRVAQAPAPPRSEHQRDRDRIVHSSAFRRLVYKTQVFVNHEGDLFRTRLTHSIEVAQLARSAARALALNEDLVEAIALAHDLGHTPFGHAGQDALHECMRECGGFEHNLQSLRVVDRLEQRYPEFDGLNLCFETREGILKHCSRRNAERLERLEPGGPAWRFVHGGQPSLEAQIVNLADEMAYCAHDIDDGVRSGLITPAQLETVPVFARLRECAQADHARLEGKRLLFEVLRRLISELVGDLVGATTAALESAAPADADAVRAAPPLARLSPALRAELDELRRFLFAELYRHPQVTQTTDIARTVVSELFAAYRSAPAEMPADYAGTDDAERAVADYIAGMTDRFALREHQRLTGRRVFGGPA